MTIYEALPKVELPGGLRVVAFVDATIEYSAESEEFAELTVGLDAPLSDNDYTTLINNAPSGWGTVFNELRVSGII